MAFPILPHISCSRSSQSFSWELGIDLAESIGEQISPSHANTSTFMSNSAPRGPFMLPSLTRLLIAAATFCWHLPGVGSVAGPKLGARQDS